MQSTRLRVAVRDPESLIFDARDTDDEFGISVPGSIPASSFRYVSTVSEVMSSSSVHSWVSSPGGTDSESDLGQSSGLSFHGPSMVIGTT